MNSAPPTFPRRPGMSVASEFMTPTAVMKPAGPVFVGLGAADRVEDDKAVEH
ncbi:MAG: hypothetical protein WAK86_18605 [Pseudonocardiaceae bacterium]